MYEKYHEQGLEIIDVPYNQFGEQAPGTVKRRKCWMTLLKKSIRIIKTLPT